NKIFQPWRSFRAVINKCLTGKSSGFDSFRNKVNWHYVRDDNIFSTIKVVSRHQNTQQYRAILPNELTNEDIRNTMAYKEYYACATGVAVPKPKASARKKRGDSDTSLTPPIATPTPITTAAPVPRITAAAKGKQPTKAKSSSDLSKAARTEAEQLKIVLRRSRQETHISQHGGSSTDEGTDVELTEAEQLKIVLRRNRHETYISQQGGSSTDEGTGSKPGVLDVPSDNSEEEISWNSFDDEDVDDKTKGRDESEGEKTDESDDDDDQEEAK
nr:hypothetical protein [Tanacetum cinerariifolium]